MMGCFWNGKFMSRLARGGQGGQNTWGSDWLPGPKSW